MTHAPSIRRGLSRVVAQVSLAWSLAVFGVVWVAVHQKVDDVLDGALQESAEILYGLLHADARWVPDQHGGALPAPPHTEHLVWQLVSPDGHVRLRSHSAPAQALGPSTHDKWFDDGPEWHTYGMPFDAQGAMLFVAQPHDERSRARLEAAGLTAAGALLVGLICALWLSRRASRELEPLVEMSTPSSTWANDWPATWPASVPSAPTRPTPCAPLWPAWAPSWPWPSANARQSFSLACSAPVRRPTAWAASSRLCSACFAAAASPNACAWICWTPSTTCPASKA
jgi:hypothetical protein